MNPDNGTDIFVLIVEDEYDNREIMRSVVEDMLGYKALLASDGSEALRLAVEHRPCMILMDLMMPVLDGFEAIRRLKADDATAGIPVVAVTALGRAVDQRQAAMSGADAYLSKPFDLELVALLIRHCVSTGSVSGWQGAGTGGFDYAVGGDVAGC